MQEVDAERRIQILRGLPVEEPSAPIEEERNGQNRDGKPDRQRKRRRIAGEDDTDRDIRFAQENNALVPARVEMQMKSKNSSDAPITDMNGHINLFPVDGTRHNAPKNAEVEAEKAKKQKEFEDQYTMRFSNAAGFKQSIDQKPWYHNVNAIGDGGGEVEAPSKDVWGNEDPRRKEREKMRIVADDPLAAIQKGVAGVREVGRERKKWKEEKDREIRELEDAERRRERKRKKRREADDLENFSLDNGAPDEHARRHRHRHHHHHQSKDGLSPSSHRRRSRSPDRSRHRSHHSRHKPVVVDNRAGWEVGPGGRYSSQFAHA